MNVGLWVLCDPVAVISPRGQCLAMRGWYLLLLLSLLFQSRQICAQGLGQIIAAPSRPQLHGLTADEATSLVARLAEAQLGLRAGQFQAFELSAGSVASYEMTKVSPRDAFLRIPFEKVWKFERVSGEDQYRRTYKLAYAPDGLGQLYWEMEVMLGGNGDLERVLMTYKPPAPF